MLENRVAIGHAGDVVGNRACAAGDAIAREILHSAAQQLAMLTSSVRRQAWAPVRAYS